MILEFAPTLVCIVLAGVVGSKIASELGNMRVSEQIDALEIMGINTKTYLVLPKILAALMMIPLLVVISMALGIWGGRVAGVASGILAPNVYDKGFWKTLFLTMYFLRLIKGYTFAFIISSIPAYYGYYVQGGALEIGSASTKAVVVSCVAILFADYYCVAVTVNSECTMIRSIRIIKKSRSSDKTIILKDVSCCVWNDWQMQPDHWRQRKR